MLRQYADHHDELAFAELVRRHIDLVYSVALRQANGDTHLAEDATQAVFTDLARKARSLSGRATLAGWLHTSARFAAGNAVRSEARRRAREHEAITMHELTSAPDVNWEHFRPLLDESVGQLKEADRDAIVLRFFEGKSHEEIGAILGLSENLANKRVERALEKLRECFEKRGVKASSALLATAIAENSVQAAPEGLAACATVAAVATASTATGSLFFKTLYMNTPAKLIIAAAVVVLVAVIILNWPHLDQPPVASTPRLSTAVSSTVSVPIAPKIPAQVAPPVVAAVNPAKPSIPTTADLPADFDPRAAAVKTELRSNLDFLIQLTLKDIHPGGSGDFYGLPVAQLIQDKSFLDMTPKLNAAGDLATFTATDETVAKIRAALVAADANTWLKHFDDGSVPFRRLLFVKINGKWYEADQRGVPTMDDKGDPYITGDPFSKK